MNFDEIKNYLGKLKESPELIEGDLSIIETTIHEIILAEKKYSYGLEKTTSTARQAEIERIVIKGLEKYKHENQKD